MKNDRELFELYKDVGIIERNKDEHLKNLINKFLIQSLYYPVVDPVKTKVDYSRLEYYNIDAKEPINWGDLGVSWVDTISNFICIEEAAPDECPTFCEYIQTHLHAWGWNEFKIITEW